MPHELSPVQHLERIGLEPYIVHHSYGPSDKLRIRWMTHLDEETRAKVKQYTEDNRAEIVAILKTHWNPKGPQGRIDGGPHPNRGKLGKKKG